MQRSDEVLLEIIENNGIITAFQPMVSLKRKSVFALEALSRGVDPKSGEIIPPSFLFGLASKPAVRLALDRACRENAFRKYAELMKDNAEVLLSVNMDISCLGQRTRGTRNVLKSVKQYGIPPSNVIIEIIESKARDMNVLLEFIEFYRKRNFLIALDDVGAGYSNLDRIPLIKPDVLKMDRSLVSGVHEQFHKLEVLKSFVQMAGRIGSLVVAEGVETEEEALCLLENGVDVLQGFHFARPGDHDAIYPGLEEQVENLAAKYKERVTRRINEDKHRLSEYEALMLTLGMDLASVERDIDHELVRYIDAHPSIECLYVLDFKGRQISNTVCNPDKLKKSKRLLYEPADRGTDHSLKEYYLPIRAGLEKYTTQPYISLASGNRCITISHLVHHRADLRNIILCADISES